MLIENLDGWWHAYFDEQRGMHSLGTLTQPTGGWGAIEEFKESVPVPGAWRDRRPGYRGIVWYERPFMMPDGWRGEHAYLYCGGIRSQARLFLDCVPIGQVILGEAPFSMSLGQLRPGGIYRICFCVWHTDDTGGITGSVSLETRPEG